MYQPVNTEAADGDDEVGAEAAAHSRRAVNVALKGRYSRLQCRIALPVMVNMGLGYRDTAFARRIRKYCGYRAGN